MESGAAAYRGGASFVRADDRGVCVRADGERETGA